MSNSYRHLSTSDRVTIEVLLDHGVSQSGIAHTLRRHRSTVCREIQRAGSMALGRYRRYLAHFGALHYDRARQHAGRQRRKLGHDLSTPLWLSIIAALELELSPEQYAGRIAMLDGLGGPLGHHGPLYASHPTIYQAIRDLPHGPDRSRLTRLLRQSTSGRRRPRRRARHTSLRDTRPLSDRSNAANTRTEFGHWEGDLIKGSFNGSAIGTLVERVSRKTILVHLRSSSAGDVLRGFRRALRSLPPHARLSLTYDRGSEMALHKDLAKSLAIDIFFCPAYSPGLRGTNENTNGLLRQYFPKGTDLSVHSPSHLRHVQSRLNHRPRRILGFLTPQERFNSLLTAATLPPSAS